MTNDNPNCCEPTPALKSERKANRFCWFLVLTMIVIVILANVNISQTKKLSQAEIHYAYSLCTLIDLQEENLLLKYNIVPSQVEGLSILEDMWHDNPCYETAKAYSDALCEFLEFLDAAGDDFFIPFKKKDGTLKVNYV